MTNRQEMLWKRHGTQQKVKAHQNKVLWKRHLQCFGKGTCNALEKAPNALEKATHRCFGKGTHCALEKAHELRLFFVCTDFAQLKMRCASETECLRNCQEKKLATAEALGTLTKFKSDWTYIRVGR